MMIHHEPNEPQATWPPSAPVNEVLGNRPLIVETYSRKGILGKRYYWRVKHTSNGEILGSGEGYSRMEDRDHIVDVLWPDVQIVSLG